MRHVSRQASGKMRWRGLWVTPCITGSHRGRVARQSKNFGRSMTTKQTSNQTSGTEMTADKKENRMGAELATGLALNALRKPFEDMYSEAKGAVQSRLKILRTDRAI